MAKKSGSNSSRLYVPEPPFRPGDTPDYSHIAVPAAHSPARPDPCLLYTSPSPRDATLSRMPSSA